MNELLSKAQSGEAEAQHWVGVLYTEGRVPKNLAQGGRWLLKSAEQGHAPVQFAYGLLSRLANPSLGERWLRRAAEQGHAEGNMLLTNEYRDGVGAHWTFLSDPGRKVQKDPDIAEYTDPEHNPMIPHVIVLEPGLVIFKIYNGYWSFSRPSRSFGKTCVRC